MQPLQLLRLGHMGMLVSLVLSVCAIAMGYWFYHGLSLALQVAAHVSLILFLTLLKLSYLARLVALNQLGRAVD